MKLTSKSLLTFCALAATTLFATAQDENRDRNRGDRGGSPEEFRQRMAERLKSSLKVTDEEWSVIQPLMEKVTAKQREAMGSRFGGRGGPGGDRGGDQPPRPGQAESDALRKAVETDGTSPEELKTKLNAVREQRKKAAAELAAAREELRKVLSVRQEATLVSMGILE